MDKMAKQFGKSKIIAASRRGLVVQRVLVDGWSPHEAARAFDLDEHQVAVWIADYRRHGMASLHHANASTTTLLGRVTFRFWSLFASSLGRLRRRRTVQAPTASCVVLRRAGDERGIGR
jgi:hypothetical protein